MGRPGAAAPRAACQRPARRSAGAAGDRRSSHDRRSDPALRPRALRLPRLTGASAHFLCEFAVTPGGLAKAEAAPDFAFSAPVVFLGFLASRFDRICPLAMIVSHSRHESDAP